MYHQRWCFFFKCISGFKYGVILGIQPLVCGDVAAKWIRIQVFNQTTESNIFWSSQFFCDAFLWRCENFLGKRSVVDSPVGRKFFFLSIRSLNCLLYHWYFDGGQPVMLFVDDWIRHLLEEFFSPSRVFMRYSLCWSTKLKHVST